MYILGILGSKGSRLEINVFQSSPRGINSFSEKISTVGEERMSFIQADEIERQYISEFYDTDATDYFEDTLPQDI